MCIKLQSPFDTDITYSNGTCLRM